jgi:hypothetical protein
VIVPALTKRWARPPTELQRVRRTEPVRNLAGCDPDLVSDDCHHEDKVETEGPEDQEFWAFEMAQGDGMLFRFDELVGFEGGENPGLVGS